MNINALRTKIILSAALFFVLSTLSCGMKHNIKGRVLNAETGQPIEGAVVSLHWYYYRLSHQLIGFTSGYENIAIYEALSDSYGNFATTKHLKGEYDLAIYKKGYVFWSEEYVFNAVGKDKKRKNHQLKDNIIIELKPFKEHYDKFKHAEFVMKGRYGHNGPIFREAIKAEKLLYFGTKK